MIPILFDSNEMLFQTRGIGTLTDTISCTVHQIVNGEYELQMVYPTNGIHYHEIGLRNIVLAKPDMVMQAQPFRIYRISRPLNGKVTINARHIAYDLSGVPIHPVTASNVVEALEAMKAAVMVPCAFTLQTNKSDVGEFAIPAPVSLFNAMGDAQNSILTTYGGEWVFNWFNATLYDQRGTDRGMSIRYGKNLTDIQQDVDDSETWTGALGYWSAVSDETAEPVISDIIRTDTAADYDRILTVNLTNEFKEQPTVEALNEALQAYINAHDIGAVPASLTVSFALLSQSEEYRHIATQEIVGLGDTVHVYYADYGINASTRVMEAAYNVLLDRYDSITLGSVTANFAQQMSANAKELATKPTIGMVETIATSLSDHLLGANGGAVRLLDTNGDGEPDTLYIADNPDPNLAVKVWRFNYEGWASSETGYGGPYTMGATLDDGLLADFVTAAHLTAGTISSENGNFTIDLGTGMLHTSVTATYSATDYSSDDITRMSNIILGSITPTQADLDKYDFYGTGDIDVFNIQLVQRMIQTGEDLTMAWTVDINPSDRAETFKVASVATIDEYVDTRVALSAGAYRTSAEQVFVNGADVLGNGLLISGTLAVSGTLTGATWPTGTRALIAVIDANDTKYTTYLPTAVCLQGNQLAVYDGTVYQPVEIYQDDTQTVLVSHATSDINSIELYYSR